MLQAIVQRKVQLFSIVGEGAQRREDAITAAVFGPLAYLSHEEAWRALQVTLLRSLPPLTDDCTGMSLDLVFWPKRPSSERDRFIEPDLEISVRFGAGALFRVLVEVKWDSPFSDRQLLAQWRSLSAEEQEHTWHVILVRHRAHAERHLAQESALASADELKLWASRRVIVTWHDLARRLWHLSQQRSVTGTGLWAAHALTFLRHVGVAQFTGFQDLQPVPLLSGNRALFVRHRWFSRVTTPAM